MSPPTVPAPPRRARLIAGAVWGGEGDPTRPPAVDAGTWRRMSRPSRLAAVVVVDLLGEHTLRLAWGAGWPGSVEDPRAGLGLVLATGIGEFSSSVAFLRSLHTRGPAGASPLVFQTSVHSAAAGQLSIAFGLRGPADVLCGTGDWTPGVLFVAASRARAGVPTLLVAVDEGGPEVRLGFELAGRVAPPERAAAVLLGAGEDAAEGDAGPAVALGAPTGDTDLVGPLVGLASAARAGARSVLLPAPRGWTGA